jgi:hypothetical protein
MRRAILLVFAAAVAACSAGAPPDGRPLSPFPGAPHGAAPTTRLALPEMRARDARDVNCDAYPDQASAQRALRADPRDPYGLDADGDGIACEHNGPPFDTGPVRR